PPVWPADGEAPPLSGATWPPRRPGRRGAAPAAPTDRDRRRACQGRPPPPWDRPPRMPSPPPPARAGGSRPPPGRSSRPPRRRASPRRRRSRGPPGQLLLDGLGHLVGRPARLHDVGRELPVQRLPLPEQPLQV